MSGRGTGGKVKARRSRSSRSNLKFPVGRIHRLLRKRPFNSKKIGAEAAVYLAAVMEYITTEILQLAGYIAKDDTKYRINPHHLQLTFKNDEAFNKLQAATIPTVRHVIAIGLLQKIYPSKPLPSS